MKHRVLVGLAAAGIIGGATYGFAATLTPTSDNLGAGSDGVESCDSAVAVEYSVAYDAAVNGFEVDDVTVTGINAAECANQSISVALTGDSNALLAQKTDSVGGTSEVFDFASDNEAASTVTGVHVVIDGVDVVVAP